MKKLLVSSFLLGGILIACAEKQPVPAIPSDPEIEGKIEKLLKNLTLEEKIGQMCELTIGVITDKSGQKLSEDLLDTVIGKYKVGSILNIPFGVSQKKEVFADVITQIQKKSLEEIRIPCIYGLDQIHGASYTQDATFFPLMRLVPVVCHGRMRLSWIWGVIRVGRVCGRVLEKTLM